MSPHLEEQLQRDYPEMFQELYGDMSVTCMAFGLECSDGWYDILVSLCRQIKENKDESVIFNQIKEKWGTLTIYHSGGTEESDMLVVAAEAASRTICEVCGTAGELSTNGWHKVRCEEHT